MLKLDEKKEQFEELKQLSHEDLVKSEHWTSLSELPNTWAEDLDFSHDAQDDCSFADFQASKKEKMDEVEHFIMMLKDWVHEVVHEKEET